MKDQRKVYVDFSWELFRSWHAFSQLSITEDVEDENGVQTITRPTGHVFGILRDVFQLSNLFKEVVLVLDGGNGYRRAIYPEYKTGRKPLEFPIFQDRNNILRVASYLNNVQIAWKKDYEADDLIATEMRNNTDQIVVFTRDKDIFQTKGRWQVLADIQNGEPHYLDMIEYLRDFTSTEKLPGLSGLTYLPVWWKVVRGDSSDHIPPGIPHLRTEKLYALVAYMGDSCDLNLFMKYLDENEFKKVDKDAIWRNYRLVLPRYVDGGESYTFKVNIGLEETLRIMHSYQLQSLIPMYTSR